MAYTAIDMESQAQFECASVQMHSTNEPSRLSARVLAFNFSQLEDRIGLVYNELGARTPNATVMWK